MTKTSTKWFLLLLGLIYLLLQLPFIKADPDVEISWSRGANTDEGLHSGQIRNYIHHGTFDITESDNFIKTPLFGAYLYFPLLWFGSSLSVARWAMVFPFFAMLLWIAWRNNYFRNLLFVFIPLVLFEYSSFNFAHFSLAEMPSNYFIFSSVLLMAFPISKNKIWKYSILVALFISIAYLLKIQFLYIVFLPPILFFIYFFKRKTGDEVTWKMLLYTNLFLVGIFALYILLWYLPNKDFFNYVMIDQTTDRFAKLPDLFNHVKAIHNIILLGKYLAPFTIAFYFLFPLGIFLSFKNTKTEFKKIFLGLSIWWLLECHKIGMVYLPTRYLMGFIFSMTAINALVIFELMRLCWENKKYNKWIFIPTLAFGILLIFNIYNYKNSYDRRTYSIRKINQYLDRYDFDDRPVIGAWAPSLTWKTNARTYPVWGKYFNDQDVLTKQKPAIIISEVDENDSNQAYLNQNIQIDQYADSIHYFQIHHIKLKLLWMKEL